MDTVFPGIKHEYDQWHVVKVIYMMHDLLAIHNFPTIIIFIPQFTYLKHSCQACSIRPYIVAPCPNGPCFWQKMSQYYLVI